jgi:UPF0755 protein
MKKARIVILLLLLVIAFIGWRFFGSNTNFNEEKKNFYIKTGSSFEDVIIELDQQNIIKNTGSFSLLAKRFEYDKNIKPGKYVIRKGMSIFRIFRMLRSGNQTAVNFTITKLRTKENFTQKIAANFECDSTTFIDLLNNNDSLSKYNIDSNTVMTEIIPDTYSILWNTSPSKILKRIFAGHDNFWNDDRKKEAAALNLSSKQVYILASIVEEETNAEQDKGKIASVYLNRLHAGMKLGADPTIKFALHNFGLKRIYEGYINACATSPYNTYKFAGLPPGPICTPSVKTLDAVLNEPVTNYLYFVAMPNNSGLSTFTDSYTQHQINAKIYQHYLDSINIK